MVSRTAVVLLAASLVPATVFAQRQGGGARGSGVTMGGTASGGNGQGASGHGGYGTGLPAGNLGNVAPFTGYGNINHPGLGYAPNTPGIGYSLAPGIQPLPTIAQPRVGQTRQAANPYGRPGHGYYGGNPARHVHGYGCGHYGYGYGYGDGYGGPVIVAVPVPVPFVNGYTYTSEAYGYPATDPQAPNVIVIQQPPAQDARAAEERPRHWPKPAPVRQEPEQESSPIYITRAAPAEDKPTAPLTLLVFKDHSIHAVNKYWREGDRLYYVTSYGAQNSVSLEMLDLEFTKRLNDERNVRFEL